QFQFYVFGDSPVANVDVGDAGFVFLNSHNVEHPHSAISSLCTPNARQIEKTRAAMTALASVARSYGATMTFAIVPSKPLLYPERLPATVPETLRKACLSLKPAQSAAGQLKLAARSADIDDEGYRVFFPFGALYAMRDQPAFYPPGNFHASSMINHEFAAGLLDLMDIEPGAAFARSGRLKMIRADLNMMGFNRRVQAWTYPYADYAVVFKHREPAWVKRYYSKARDFGQFEAAHPASQRSALLLSNSFGHYMAPHLAIGFRSLRHINVNALDASEAVSFLRQVLEKVQPDDVIYLIHDGGIPNTQLEMLAEAASE
ncbi:MAG: hypothetical protein NWQ45_04700, partial [Congregibacter sp.]|nr:hypothetical protein [Congregibacter sp.]